MKAIQRDQRFCFPVCPTTVCRELAKELGYDHVTLWMIDGVGHNTMEVSTERVLDWAIEQRLTKHPRRVTHHAYFPIHGKAYWTEISGIEEIGTPGRLAAERFRQSV